MAFSISHSQIAIGIVSFCELIPLFFGVALGALVDRWNKVKILYLCDWGRAVLLMLLGVLYLYKLLNIPVLCAGAFLMSFQSLLFTPSRMAIMPTLFAKDMLQKASSFLNTFSLTALIIGKMLCGFFIPLISYSSIFFIDSVTFVISAWFLMRLRTTHPTPRAEETAAETTAKRGGMMREMKEAFGILIRNKPWVRVICFFLIVNLLVAGLLQVILPILALNRFGSGYSEWFSFMYSGFQAGMLSGSLLLFLRTGSKNIFTVFPVCLILAGGFVFGLSFPLAGFEVLLLVLMGALISFVDVQTVVYLQKEIPQEYGGRIFTLIYSLVKVAEPISVALYTSLLFLLSPNRILLLIGVTLIVAISIFAFGTKMREAKQRLKGMGL